VGSLVAVSIPGVRAAAIDAFPAGKYSVKNFKVQDYQDDGSVAWRVKGAQADASGRWVTVQGLIAKLFVKEDEFSVQSPVCRFDRLRQTGSSDEAVHAEGNGMVIDGVGFDLDLDRRRLKVRSRVRVRFQGRSAAALLESQKSE
jgi:hypothetical protein